MKNHLLQRFREPSTWAGLAALGLLCGIDPGKVDAVAQAGAAIAAAAAVLLPERPKE